jgi:ATP-dependent DNA helicase RecG
MVEFRMADIVQDKPLVEHARKWVETILQADPELNSAENLRLKTYLQSLARKNSWSSIS